MNVKNVLFMLVIVIFAHSEFNIVFLISNAFGCKYSLCMWALCYSAFVMHLII